MEYFKVFLVSLLACLVSCEPPVQGYNYRQPSRGYNTHRNSYVPPSPSYSPPTNSYLPPTSFGSAPSGFQGADYDNSHGHGHGQDHGHGHGHGQDNEVPKSYEFGYSVKDAQSGNDYGRHESSDGNVVRGEYRVQLPDGRTQIVTYHADWQTGFHADVRYEGEARYPEPAHNNNNYNHNNNNNNQGYNYNTPDYSGSLSGFQGNQGYKPSTAYGTPGYH